MRDNLARARLARHHAAQAASTLHRYDTLIPARLSTGNGWDRIQSWREAVDEWQRARDAYDADPTDEVVYRRLKYAEARIEALRREAAEADDDQAMDGVGRALLWLLVLLVPVAIVGWWVAWQ